MSQESPHIKKLKFAGLALFIVLIIIISVAFDPSSLVDKQYMQQITTDNLLVGSLLFISIFVILKLLFAPVTPISIFAGYLFGAWIGFLVSMAALLISSVIAFFTARYLGRQFIEQFLETRFPRMKDYNKLIKRHGLLTVFIFRIVPTGPLSMVNIILGLSKVRARDFLLGSFLGFLPTVFMLSFIGDLVTDFTNPVLYLWIAAYISFIAIVFFIRRQVDL